MNVAFNIAKRIAFNRQPSFSRFIIRLSVAATAVSVAAMIITMSFANGFQKVVSEKVFSFWGHIRVQHLEADKALVAEETPIAKNDTVLATIRNQKEVTHVQAFATKSAVIEKKKEIEGVLFKGIEADYDSSQLKQFIVKGSWLHFPDSLYSREILISQPVAQSLQIEVNDTINIYFITPGETTGNYRKLRVAGIFKTGIEEYDKLFAIGDLRLIQRLSNWEPNEIGGYEIFIKDYKNADSVKKSLNDQLPQAWEARTIKEIYPNIFDWLNIQNLNKNLIFIIMGIVAIINLITCLLILVLERTKMIGVLKAVGTNNWTIQQIFLYYASVITALGIGIGLIAGVGICLLQQGTHFITLDESSYYVSYAPIAIVWWQVGLICLCTAIVCFISLLLPTLLVRNVQPVKAIQFK
ncbi:ABC transporter permease [Chitinophagaceae bacterium LWZ2-11]